MGWPSARVLIIDEDLGRSGQTAQGRPGFQRLLAEVGLDHVGLILGIEMSRLARSCKDWYQLLELCALFGTLLADQDGIYDPTHYNDRLLLGLKGTMSEAELHLIRARMSQGLLNKAARGEVYYNAPIGYVRLPGGGLVLDPDEQAQGVIRLIFDKFDELGSATAVLAYLVRNDIRLGVRPHGGPDRGQLQWRRPVAATLITMLHNPTYAGAYAHGRRPTDPRRKIPGRRSTGHVLVPMEHWEVLLRDHLPAYITWDRYLANQRRLAANRAKSAAMGAPREGLSLLGGLLYCGRCGSRMMVCYGKTRAALRYCCMQLHMRYSSPSCQSFSGGSLDELISGLVLRVAEPATLELSLWASADVARERERLTQHWQQRLERARYEADRAARQYQACEPENRLVARELERRWDRALLEQRQLRDDYDRFLREQPQGLSEGDRELIRSLASDLPALWHSSSTTAKDRQVIVRHLIEQIVVALRGETEWMDVTVRWAGGFVSRHECRRPVQRYGQLRDFGAMVELIDHLYEAGYTPSRIADRLNADGFHPPKLGEKFGPSAVAKILTDRHPIGPRPLAMADARLRRADEWWMSDLARHLGIYRTRLLGWALRGYVHGRIVPEVNRRWLIWADADELERLRRLRDCSRNHSYGPAYPPRLTTPKVRDDI
jgi:DNA invertase Pin-like site-specific DNA recombinase